MACWVAFSLQIKHDSVFCFNFFLTLPKEILYLLGTKKPFSQLGFATRVCLSRFLPFLTKMYCLQLWVPEQGGLNPPCLEGRAWKQGSGCILTAHEHVNTPVGILGLGKKLLDGC